MKPYSQRTSGLGFIFVLLLIDVLGIGLIVPILPKFIAELSHHTLSESSRDYGWLIALYSAMQFLFAPLIGMLSDRFGRRPVLLVSMLFAGIDYAIMALAPTLTWLYVGRIISGVTGASFTAASAYIADVSPPEKRAQNFGLIGSAFGIGFIIGPAAGGLLGQWGPRIPFWAAAGLCFANLLYGFFILPESLQPENRRAFNLREANPIGALKVLAKYPVVWGLAGSMIASNLAMQSIHATWVLYMTYRFGWTPRDIGFSLAFLGVVSLVYQLGIARWLFPRLGDRRTMVLSLAFGVFEYLAYALIPYGWMVYVVIFIAGMAFLAMQATQGVLSKQVGADEQGTLQGALSSLASLTGIVGTLISAELFAHFTSPQVNPKVPSAPFYLATALSLLALIIAIRVLRRLPSRPTNAVEAI